MKLGNRGFTLIELLIVVAIISILAAVLLPNILNARTRTMQTSATTYLRDTMTSLESVQAANTKIDYRATAIASDVTLVNTGTVNNALVFTDSGGTNLASTNMREFVKTPANGVSNVYLVARNNASSGKDLYVCASQLVGSNWYLVSFNIDTSEIVSKRVPSNPASSGCGA